MPNQQDTRAVRCITSISGNQVIAILLLRIKACGEAKSLKPLLQISPYRIHTSFGIGAGVDIDESLQISKVLLHLPFGLLHHLVCVHHMAPPARNWAISSSL